MLTDDSLVNYEKNKYTKPETDLLVTTPRTEVNKRGNCLKQLLNI